ncbi:MAG: hypothetical protein ACRDRG_18310 [Pseudonocardiaceae bacterium]
MTTRAGPPEQGWPLVAPVWFLVEEGELLFNTEPTRPRGRAVARDPRLVVDCVDSRGCALRVGAGPGRGVALGTPTSSFAR